MLLLILGGLLFTVGDIFIKKWIIDNSLLNFFIGLIFWIIGLLILAYSSRFINIVSASFIEILANIITLVFADYFFFKDPVTLQEIVGIITGLIAIYIIELK